MTISNEDSRLLFESTYEMQMLLSTIESKLSQFW